MAVPAPAVTDEADPSVTALIAARPFLSMHAFDGLLLEGVPLAGIAAALGTPCWVYSAGTMRARLAELTAAMAGLARVHYAVKANDHLAVLRLMRAGGAGADVVSAGEFLRARQAGIAAADIVFSGVGKTAPELRLAIGEGIGQINAESVEELEVISALAAAMGRSVPVALRINPDIDAGTHAKITTGTAKDKFGIPFAAAIEVYARAAELPGWSRWGWRCISAARFSPSRRTAPPSRGQPGWCGRCGRAGWRCGGWIAAGAWASAIATSLAPRRRRWPGRCGRHSVGWRSS